MYSPLIQEALECLIQHGDLWPRRQRYVIEELINEKEKFLENLSPTVVCRDVIVGQARNEIKKWKKVLKTLKEI